MPRSNYFFESGEGIFVGFHGEHDYVFVSGEPLSDCGGAIGIGGHYSEATNGDNVNWGNTDATVLWW